MTPEVKRVLLATIRECLRNSPVAKSLNGCWEDELFLKHLEHLERNPTIITTIPAPFGGSNGWVSVWQEGSGLTVILWSTQPKDSGAKEEVRETETSLVSRLAGRARVQIRWTQPHEFLGWKGWPLRSTAQKAKKC